MSETDLEVQAEEQSLLERQIANGWKDLGEQDRAFAVEYLTNGFKHNNAAEAVGLARSSGLTKLRTPIVGAFIGFLQDQSSTAKLITRQFVEAQYLEILPMLKGEENVPIHDQKSGETVMAKKFHSAEIVSVLRDLGKGTGYIAPDNAGDGGATVNVQINLSDLRGD